MTTDRSRDAFEKWAKVHRTCFNLTRFHAGYEYSETETNWLTWQQAWNAARADMAEELVREMETAANASDGSGEYLGLLRAIALIRSHGEARKED